MIPYSGSPAAPAFGGNTGADKGRLSGGYMPGGCIYTQPGASKDYKLEGYSDNIVSRDIVSFYYRGNNYNLSYGPAADTGVVHLTTSGGNYSARDGSAYSIDIVPDFNDSSSSASVGTLLTALQKIVEEDNVAGNNGYYHETGGLPAGLGDTVRIEYASGEKIYKSSNQSVNILPETAKKFNDAFRKYVQSCGFDYTTEGSNVKIYDDADEEYLQGTWKGTHFGCEYTAVFTGKNVKIYKDNTLTDDCEYSITCGQVRTALKKPLAPGQEYRGDQFDYEEFSEISEFSKNNYFTLTAYFCKDSCSTLSLHNFDKTQPDNSRS